MRTRRAEHPAHAPYRARDRWPTIIVGLHVPQPPKGPWPWRAEGAQQSLCPPRKRERAACPRCRRAPQDKRGNWHQLIEGNPMPGGHAWSADGLSWSNMSGCNGAFALEGCFNLSRPYTAANGSLLNVSCAGPPSHSIPPAPFPSRALPPTCTLGGGDRCEGASHGRANPSHDGACCWHHHGATAGNRRRPLLFEKHDTTGTTPSGPSCCSRRTAAPRCSTARSTSRCQGRSSNAASRSRSRSARGRRTATREHRLAMGRAERGGMAAIL